MTPDTFNVSPRQIEEATAELRRLETTWQEHNCVLVSESELDRRVNAANEWADSHAVSIRKVRCLIEKVDRLREDYFSLQNSLDACERRRKPTMAICAALLGVLVSVVFGLCTGAAVNPPLGLLVGFIVLCLTSLAVVWFEHRRQVAEGRAIYLSEELDKSTAELSRLEEELDQAKSEASAIRQRWVAAYRDYKNVAVLHKMRLDVQET